MRSLLIAALSAAAICASFAAQAGAKEDAKRHFDSGVVFMNSEEFAAAAIEFEESTKLFMTKTALFNLANCYRALQRFGESLATLALLDSQFGKGLAPEMKEAAARMRAEIENSTGSITVRADKEDSTIFVDGEVVGKSPLALPVRVTPGYHEVRAEREGMAKASQKVKVVSGEEKTVELWLVPEPAAAGPPKAEKAEKVGVKEVTLQEPPVSTPEAEEGGGSKRRVLGHVALWSGVAFVGLGIAGTAVGKVKGDEWRDTGSESAADASRSWAGAMWAGYGIGLALVATGIVLWTLPEKRDREVGAVALAPLCDGRSCALAVSGEF